MRRPKYTAPISLYYDIVGVRVISTMPMACASRAFADAIDNKNMCHTTQRRQISIAIQEHFH